MSMTHKEYADGMREVAAWIESHPEIELPWPEFSFYNLDEKEDAQKFVRALGKVEKDYTSDYLWIKGKVGGFDIKSGFPREKVCVRKVVGKKIIAEVVLPARGELVIPEKIEDIVEWDCEPILKPVEQAA